jgi:hypothetical protein
MLNYQKTYKQKEVIMKSKKMRFLIGLTIIIVAITATIASAYGNPGVLSPNHHVQGLSDGEWSAIWWQHILAIPNAENPLVGATGTNCIYDLIGNVGLIMANPQAGEVLSCEVPRGTMLYLDIVSAECSTLEEPPFYGGDEEGLRACAEGFAIEDLQATIDGIDVRNLDRYLHTSPLFEFTVPEDNILYVDAGSGESISYGAHLMLAPLSPGVHEIYLYGYVPDLDFAAEQTLQITVTQ